MTEYKLITGETIIIENIKHITRYVYDSLKGECCKIYYHENKKNKEKLITINEAKSILTMDPNILNKKTWSYELFNLVKSNVNNNFSLCICNVDELKFSDLSNRIIYTIFETKDKDLFNIEIKFLQENKKVHNNSIENSLIKLSIPLNIVKNTIMNTFLQPKHTSTFGALIKKLKLNNFTLDAGGISKIGVVMNANKNNNFFNVQICKFNKNNTIFPNSNKECKEYDEFKKCIFEYF